MGRTLTTTALSPLGVLMRGGDAALRGTLIAALVMSPTAALAQTAEVKPVANGAGSPTLDMAANGTPIVKIATPSAGGTSYNRYDAFNVDARGLVLNNSSTITTTAIAGFIDGNRNLKTSGPATLIVNEVVGTARSVLGGYIEIAGAKADLILANPYGISCNGCGFVNAPSVTLAAATPVVGADGAPTGFAITGGTLDVGGAGLDASGARLALFARAITLNAAVFADRVDVGFGAGDATTAPGGDVVVTARPGALAEQPAFGLDVAALGGMYARSIRLIGTEAGLGVNVAGTLSGLEGVSLSAAGRVTIGGTVSATTSATVASTGAVTVDGQFYGEGGVSVTAGSLGGTGLVASGGDLAVTAGAIDTASTLAAGLARDGQLSRQGSLTLTSAGRLATTGRALASGALTLSGRDIVLGGQVRAGTVTATGTTIANTADARSAGAMSLTGALTNAGLLQARDIMVRGGSLDNRGGVIDAGGRGDIVTGAIANAGGSIQSGGALALTGTTLANGSGAVLALGGDSLTLDLTGDLTSAGRIGGNGDVGVRAAAIAVGGAGAEIVAARALTLTATGDLLVDGGARVAAGTASAVAVGGRLAVLDGGVQAVGSLDVKAGAVAVGARGAVAAGSLDIGARGAIDNLGTILGGAATGTTTLTAGARIDNRGTIQANGTALSIGAATVANGGTIAHAGTGRLALTANGLTANTGSIASNGELAVTTGSLFNTGALGAAGNVTVAGTGAVANGGSLAAGGTLVVTGATVAGTGGSFQARGPLSLNAGAIELGDAAVLALGAAPLAIASTGALTANGARIGGNGAVALSAGSMTLGGSTITALGTLDVRTSAGDILLGREAELSSVGDLTLGAAGLLDANGATIATDAVARLSGRAIGFADGLLQADRFELAAPTLSLRRARLRQTGTADFVLRTSGTIDYSNAELYSGGTNFTVDAGSLLNRGGALLHAGTGTMTIGVTGAVDNSGGRVATNGALALSAGQVENAGGTITADRAGTIALGGALGNADGLIATGAGLSLRAGAVGNAGGAIETTGLLDARLGSLSGSRGTVLATGADARLALDVGGAMTGPGALIGSTGTVAVAAGSMALGDGARLTAGGALTATARTGDLALDGGTIDGASVTLGSAGTIATGEGGAIVTPGVLMLTGAVDLSGGVAQGDRVALTGAGLVTTGGVLQSTGSLALDVRGLVDNRRGEIFAGGVATIAAGAIANADGRIASAGTGTLALRVAGLTDNTDGTIVGNGALTLASGSLVNARGVIASAIGGDLRVADTLDNAGGDIRSDRALLIEAGRLANDAGRVDGLGSVTVRAGVIDNGSGSIVSRGDAGLTLVGLTAGTLAIDNGAGTIGAAGALAIDAATIVNRGTIEASDATLRFGSLANAGDLYANTLTLGGTSLINTGGRIGSGTGALGVTVGSVDNRGGALVSGIGGLTVASTTILNDGGTIGGAAAVTLGAATIDNGAGTIAAGSDLTLRADTLTNALGGAIWAERDGAVALTATLANRGSIAAARMLSVTAPTIDNGVGADAGVIAAGDTLSVDFVTGTLGRLVGERALDLAFVGDYVNAQGQILTSRGAFNLRTGGSFTNAGVIESATGIGITAATGLTNAATGEIAAPTVALTAGTTLTNLGLINGGAVTLRGDAIVNESRIFGDSVRIAGTTSVINRGAGAVIATRGDLLGIESSGAIENRDGASLYALGDIAIGGLGGTGRAGSFTNSSATVQAQGDLAIAAGLVVNNRAVFTTEELIASVVNREFENRTNRENRTILEYVETVTDTAITGDSGASTIVARDITVDADTLTNTISTISASGDLTVGATAVTNTAFTGYNRVSQIGETRVERRSCFFVFGCGGWRTRSRTPYSSIVEEPIFTIDSSITAGGTLAIDARSIDNLVVDASGESAATFAASATGITGGAIGAGSTVGTVSGGTTRSTGGAPTGRAIAGVEAIEVNAETLGVTGSAAPTAAAAQFGFALAPVAGATPGAAGASTLALGGLFRFAAPTATFLVETDPAFTSYNSFLSSDYFIGRLGYDPSRVQRRLGDALYEQQLVTNQLVAQAGVGRLANFASNEAQYRALMDAGVAYAKRYDLALGVALSPEQMATLTTDIVLLEEVTVPTANGPVKVLAPRVYLTKVGRADLTSRGAVIAGTDLALRGADSLTNAGVLRATATARVTGGDVVNTGRIDLGARGEVAATRDLIDRGGTITGGDVVLSAGRDLRLEPVAVTGNVATFYRGGGKTNRLDFATTTTNRGSVVDVGGNLDLLAGRSLELTGATVAAGGDLLVYGGERIAIGSAVDTSVSSGSGRAGKTSFTESASSSTNVVSTLSAGGDATIATPGALGIAGGAVVAGGALDVGAGSIAVTGVVDQSSAARDTVRRSGGLLSSTRTTTKYDGTDESVVASTLSGDTVALRSTGDTRIAGSNVVATNGVTIGAGGAIEIGTLTATDREQQSTRVKTSGLSIGGGGLFIGVAKTRNDADTTSVTNTGSLVGSSAGDVTLDAGRALSVTGSQIAGNGLTRLTGESVSIRNATDVTTTDTLSKSSSIGLSVGIQSPVLSGLQGVRDAGEILGNANTNARTTAVAGIAGGLAAYNAADALTTGGDNLASLSVSLGVSSSKATSSIRDETNVASRIAGNDVAIAARGAGDASTITVQGSDIVAARDLSLAAPGAITLRSGTETDTLAQANTSSGFSVGVQIGLTGVVTPSASLSLGKGSASGTDVRHVESVLGTGNSVSIATPGALTLQGAQVSGNRVAIDAGSLAIVSEQDTATYAERQRNLGLSVSAANGGSIAGNLTSSRQNGDFASVREQSGIYAGQGGFRIDILGNTNLVAGVIASEAEAALNRLTTGTLTASELANRERYSASSLSIGGGIGGIGKNADGGATTGTDQTPGSDLPGIRTGLGTISATPPVALGASGRQAGISGSAIAPGTIVITSGDAASRSAAAAISRDTASANSGALTQQYDVNKREEIALGFAAATELANQTGTFFANRATEEQTLRDQAASATDPAEAGRLTERADALRDTYGAGSTLRLIATALNGAAGSNVTGSLGGVVQASAVNVLQGLGANQVKQIADSLYDKDGRPTAGSEGVRAALQAVVGCVGSTAGGSGSCGAAATGAAASVVVNYLLSSFADPVRGIDLTTGRLEERDLADQEARVNLVSTFVAGLAVATGLETNATATAAQLETQGNELGGVQFADCATGRPELCGPAYTRYGSFEANDPRNGAYRRQYDLALAALTDLGITPIEADIVLVLEASIGGQVDDDIAGFVMAYGGIEAVRGLVAGGQSATDLGQRYLDYLKAQRSAFVTVTQSFTLADVNRFASDPNALATLSSADQQLLRLAYTYAQANPLETIFASNSSFSSATSFLNGQYQLGTRALGALQAGFGAVGTLASGAATVASAPLCVSIIGCAAPVGFGALTVIEFDQTIAGVRTVFSGRLVNSFGAQGINALTGIDASTADLGLSLAGGGTSLVGGTRAIVTRADSELAGLAGPTAFDALGRVADETVAFRAIPTIAFNQIAGSAFERQVIEALGFVGGTKNTIGQTVRLADGTVVNTIVDATGRNVGGMLEIKNVLELSFSPQIRAQVQIATSTRTPLNIVVGPTTRRVTQDLQRQVRATGGGVYVFDPVTGALRPFGR